MNPRKQCADIIDQIHALFGDKSVSQEVTMDMKRGGSDPDEWPEDLRVQEFPR